MALCSQPKFCKSTYRFFVAQIAKKESTGAPLQDLPKNVPKISDLLEPKRFPVFEAGRVGKYTYHGPGQRVVYTMINLKERGSDVRRYVNDLEEWIIRSLAKLAVNAERRDKRIGIWVNREDGSEDKIAALGVRVRGGITFHGISINVTPNLSHFDGIIPCGINKHGVTSLADLGNRASMADLDQHLRTSFQEVFSINPKAAQELVL